MKNISIIFTREGFIPEFSEGTGTIWEQDFASDRYMALYKLGCLEEGISKDFEPGVMFLYRLSSLFFRLLTRNPDIELTRAKTRVVPDIMDIEGLLSGVPFVIGSEFIDESWISRMIKTLNSIFAAEIESYEGSVELYLTELNQDLHVPERVFFHLVETGKEEYPFAFLATYASSAGRGKIKHVPLKYALIEYEREREKLLSLLSCLNKAADVSELIAGFMRSGELFHPLRMSAEEAYSFLKDVKEIEAAGIICRVPNWWKRNSASVTLSFKIGDNEPALLGFDTLLTVQPSLEVDGMELTREDIQILMAQTDGLALIKGKWVEVSKERLEALLEIMEKGGERTVTLLEALRNSRRQDIASEDACAGEINSRNGAWLSDFLRKLRNPAAIKKARLPKSFMANLRPYQKNGFTWLSYMSELGLGACLADDMGLGKTVQVLAYLEKLRVGDPEARALLIVPASLIGNWLKEIKKFAPQMDYLILHGLSKDTMSDMARQRPAFLSLTTYGMASRYKELAENTWDCVILDEAQAIKNPLSAQTKAIKKLPSRMKIIMTGTPIENDLGNLWSLFDFMDKGLLGSSEEFRQFCAHLKDRPEGYSQLRNMVSPFMLRRVKTDKRIIADLPDKLETVDYTSLSKKQIVTYRRTVKELENKLYDSEGIERSGLILAYILKLKQICNHPDQYLGQTAYSEADSGKFGMLREICETVRDKRERVLVFTQFREITEYLSDYLEGIFGKKGFVIHGGVRPKVRSQIVEAFQGEEYVPYIVLSVKAGGTGLNLTNANHVIHFDRWWNPAVENQATDRAFRIGQTKNVMVHKLVCRGTIEEKIDQMINQKQDLADSVIGKGSGTEKWITRLSDKELMEIMRLD